MSALTSPSKIRHTTVYAGKLCRAGLVLPAQRTVKFRDKKLQMYSVGWLCAMIGRHWRTVVRWERRGILPKPILSIHEKRRYYTALELSQYARIILRFAPFCFGRLSSLKEMGKELSRMSDRIREEFDRPNGIIPTELKEYSAVVERLRDRFVERQLRRYNRHVRKIYKLGKLNEDT